MSLSAALPNFLLRRYTPAMEVSCLALRQAASRSPSRYALAYRPNVLRAASPMAIWSRGGRQFTTNPPAQFPGPMSMGSSGPSSPSYFQSRSSLPANTIIRFVPQQTAWIVERMGKFNRILEPGLAILVPIIDVRRPPSPQSPPCSPC
jgi:hypothetical protein